MIIAKFVAVVVIAYLIGSVPFGLIISRLAKGVDVREYGSGKTGATNVMRTAGTKLGIVTLVLDVAKAAGAVMLAKAVMGSDVLLIGGFSIHWQAAQVMAGLAVVAGHNWPVFAKFKGGRGVTAYFGTLFAICPPAGIFGVEVLAVSALRSQRMSMGSILGALAAWCLMVPLTITYHFPPIYLAYGLAVVALLVFQHQDNIKRLQQGTERKLW